MPIENLKKHVGQLANTGVRVAVVFRKLPNDDKHCLIVETERLPDSYHDYLIQTMNSREALETNDFYEVLHRRTFPDGLNCLTALHQRGMLRKEPVSNVTMIPLPGKQVPLALINATIDKTVDEYMKSQQTQSNPFQDSVAEAVSSAQKQAKTVPESDKVSVAKGLIMQAELLEEDAKSKREEAYGLAPELKPGRGRPADPEEIKAQKEAEKKIARRERDRAKAAERKEAKKTEALDARVSAKLARDGATIRS